MTGLEREVRRAWLRNPAHEHYGRCHVCERTHDHEGRPLYVARQPRRREFECVDCFDARVSYTKPRRARPTVSEATA